METTSVFNTKIPLGDISDPLALEDWGYLGIATLFIDVVVMALVRHFPDFFGRPVNIWYDNFQLSAVISDVFIILIGFAIARYVYTAWISPRYAFDPWMFIGLAVVIQLLHDLFFYFAVIRPIPEGVNDMMDVFKEYAASGGAKILVADAAMVIGAGLVAMVLKGGVPAHATISFGLLTVYALPYFLFKRNKWTAY